MQKIDFKVAGTMYRYNVPENWNELTHEQFIIYAGAAVNNATLDYDTVRRIVALDDVVTVSLDISQWWMLKQQLVWMEDLEGYTCGLVDEVTLPDGTKCMGFSDDFSDVTWQEWMIADAQANAGHWDIFAAVMYRPQKPDWDHKSDPKVDFSQWDCDSRLPQFQQLPADVMAAVALNYKLMRRILTKKYRRLFNYGAKPKEGEPQTGGDLHTLICNVMGDNFYEEEKYLHLAVPSVLFQLDRMVREEKERRKHANR